MSTLHSELSKSVGNPLITIAIPTFNRSSWLKGCILSALDQSYQHIEVLVSDNASTDNTAELLKTFSDPRLRVIRQTKNIGAIPNWNACLAEAGGDFIVFLCDDDKIAPWFLERCITLIRNEPRIPIVVALSDTYLSAESRRLPVRTSRRLGTGIWSGDDILKEFLRGQISPVTCTIVFRTDALRTKGGFPLDWPHVGDIAAWTSLLLTSRAGLVNERCGTYCVHGETQSSNFTTDIRLTDLRKLTDLILDMANRLIESPQKRREIRLEARRYFAGNALYLVALRRKAGVPLAELFPMIWKLRADLSQIGMRNMVRSAQLLAILVFPRALTNFVRRFLRMARQLKSRAHIKRQLED
jgi:glycosyltransferase involved in cell wall biosynthesis